MGRSILCVVCNAQCATKRNYIICEIVNISIFSVICGCCCCRPCRKYRQFDVWVVQFSARDDSNRFQKYNMRVRKESRIRLKWRRTLYSLYCGLLRWQQNYAIPYCEFAFCNWPPIKKSKLYARRCFIPRNWQLWFGGRRRQATAGDSRRQQATHIYPMIYCCRLSATLRQWRWQWNSASSTSHCSSPFVLHISILNFE